MTFAVSYPVPITRISEMRGALLLGGCWHIEWQGSLLSNHNVVPHPWSNDLKKLQAFEHIDTTYDAVVTELAAALNDYHQESLSIRAWRILLGPWLHSLSAICYEKWALVDQALDMDGSAVICGLEGSSMIPKDTYHFKDFFSSSEMGAHILFEISQARGLDFLNLPPASSVYNAAATSIQRSSLIRKTMHWLSTRMARPNDVVVFDSYLQPHAEARLQMRLRQFPSVWDFALNEADESARTNLDETWRDVHDSGDKPENLSFQEFFGHYARKKIPVVFLEGFANLRKNADSRRYPRAPKAIFTSNAYFKNDLFKYFVARSIGSGSRYFIGQHGGGYGVIRQTSDQRLIRETADNFLTWGWRETASDFPVGVIKPSLGIRSKPEGDLLLVQYVGAPLEFRVGDRPIAANGWFEYFRDQVSFLNALTPEIKARVRVRLHPHDHGYGIVERLKAVYPELRFDTSATLSRAFENCKLVVPTYPQTTFLETLSEEFPTVMFFRSEHWQISQISEAPMDNLRKAGVVFDSPIEAAMHINSIWSSMPEWWEEPSNQASRANFVDMFARRDLDVTATISSFLTE